MPLGTVGADGMKPHHKDREGFVLPQVKVKSGPNSVNH